MITKCKSVKPYDSVLKIKKGIFLFCIVSLLSCIFTNIKNYEYQNKNEQMRKEQDYTGIIISNAISKEYSTQYKLKITKIGMKSTNIIVYIRIKGKNLLCCGDEITFKGEYSEPDTLRNDKGFDYKKYLKTIGITGIVTTNQVEKININKGELLQKIACKTQNIIESNIRKKISQKEHQDVLIGILLGNDEQIEQQTKENFVDSSLSHILAVSGMHVAYIITIVDYFLSILKIGKKKTKIITIGFLLFFIMLANHTPSVIRACIMASLGIFAGLIHRKSDIINNLAISTLFILVQNPFAIWNTGFILSYCATLGILLLMPIFISKKEVTKENMWKKIWNQKIKQIVAVSVSAWIAIFPINMLLFQTISFTFIFSNLVVSMIIGIIIMLGFMISIPVYIPIISNIILTVLDLLLLILIKISEIFSSIPLSHILVCTPSIGIIILYYISVCFWIYQKKLRRKTR